MLLTSLVVLVIDLLAVQVILWYQNYKRSTFLCARKISLNVADSIGMHAEMFHNRFRFSLLFVQHTFDELKLHINIHKTVTRHLKNQFLLLSIKLFLKNNLLCMKLSCLIQSNIFLLDGMFQIEQECVQCGDSVYGDRVQVEIRCHVHDECHNVVELAAVTVNNTIIVATEESLLDQNVLQLLQTLVVKRMRL